MFAQVRFLNDRPVDTVFALTTLQAGFRSRSTEVAAWTGRLFARVGYELMQGDLEPFAWQGFVGGPNAGMRRKCFFCVGVFVSAR